MKKQHETINMSFALALAGLLCVGMLRGNAQELAVAKPVNRTPSEVSDGVVMAIWEEMERQCGEIRSVLPRHDYVRYCGRIGMIVTGENLRKREDLKKALSVNGAISQYVFSRIQSYAGRLEISMELYDVTSGRVQRSKLPLREQIRTVEELKDALPRVLDGLNLRQETTRLGVRIPLEQTAEQRLLYEKIFPCLEASGLTVTAMDDNGDTTAETTTDYELSVSSPSVTIQKKTVQLPMQGRYVETCQLDGDIVFYLKKTGSPLPPKSIAVHSVLELNSLSGSSEAMKAQEETFRQQIVMKLAEDGIRKFLTALNMERGQ